MKWKTYDWKNDRELDGIHWNLVCTEIVWLFDPEGVLNSTYHGRNIFTLVQDKK